MPATARPAPSSRRRALRSLVDRRIIPMLHRPRFKPHYRVEIVAGEGTFLLSEAGQAILGGRVYQLVTPLIDGVRSADEIVSHLRDQVSAAEAYHALAQLERKGYLVESDDTLAADEAALWAIQGLLPQAVARRLAETTVSVTPFGELAAGPLRAALETAHVRVGQPGELGVVLTDDYLRSGLEPYNKEALASGRPWLLFRPVGREVWLGPLFRPGKTGCWKCLADRLRRRRLVEDYLCERQGRREPLPLTLGSMPSTRHLAWNMAATAVASWIAHEGSSPLEGQVVTLDVRSWKTQAHALVRLPHCPACGDPRARLGLPHPPVVLTSRKIIPTLDGGHRVLRPEATLERYAHHVSPITGAVTHLERSDGAEDGSLPVYGAGPNDTRPPKSLAHLRSGLRSVRNSGKGTTDLHARASALCEGLERYSTVYRGDEPRRRARLVDLGDAGIHPNACMGFSERQYRDRDAWNARKSYVNYVPLRFDPEAEVEWAPVWSLTRQEVRYLPSAFCYYDHPNAAEQAVVVSCSNGTAAGNTLEEAILQGLLELVERDSIALWWYNRVRRPGVDLNSFDEPVVRQFRPYLRKQNRDLWVLDLTADLNVPVFVALSRRLDSPPDRIVFGFGAHLDPRIALLRALTELNQTLVMVFAADGAEQAQGPTEDTEIQRWLQAALADHPYLAPDATAPHKATDYPRPCTDDLKEEVLSCQAAVERLGMEMLVLDLTRPEIGLPVVKVIVPGLRHFWARFAPGRLYDTPVRLGWLARPLAEEQLNPVPMFI